MRVLQPATLDEALEELDQAAPDAAPVPIAGGTDLLVHWPRQRTAHRRTYIDLWGLDDLRGIRPKGDGLELGGLATYWDVVTDAGVGRDFPLLVEAARKVGAIQIQSRGTWAGNVVNGSPAADGVPVLMAYDADVVLQSASGQRSVRLDRYYSGYREGARRPDELVVAIRLPRRSYRVQRFVKVGPRRAQAIAKVGLALTRSESGWRVVAASVAPTVRRCRGVERMLAADEPIPSPETLVRALREDVQPIDDLRSTAAYRERVLARVLWDALRDAGRTLE